MQGKLCTHKQCPRIIRTTPCSKPSRCGCNLLTCWLGSCACVHSIRVASILEEVVLYYCVVCAPLAVAEWCTHPECSLVRALWAAYIEICSFGDPLPEVCCSPPLCLLLLYKHGNCATDSNSTCTNRTKASTTVLCLLMFRY